MDKMSVSTFLILFLIGALTWSCRSLQCEAPGRFADVTNCRSFLNCEADANGRLIANVLSCNTSEVFNPSLSECVPSDKYICLQDDALNNIETNNSLLSESKLIKDFICIWPGIKFPDYSSINCSHYFACVYQSGNVRKVLQLCPTNQIFDIEKNMCMDSSLSNCRRSDWGEPDKLMYKYIDTVHNINITVTTVKNLTNCRDSSRFLNAEEPDCRSYMSCERNADGSFTQQFEVCPERYIFDPFLSICVEERYFQCEVKTISNANLHEYYGSYAEYMKWRSLRHECGKRQRCKNVGIYPDYSVPGCRGFQLCLKTDELSYKSISQICPQGYVFNAVKSMCTINDSNSCPCNIQYDSENTTIEIDHHETYQNHELATETYLLPSNSDTSTSIPERYDCPKTIEQCSEEGMFANYSETGCSGFVFCAKLNETAFSMLNVQCPENYAFDANDSQCKPTNNYKCPCHYKLLPTNEAAVKPDDYSSDAEVNYETTAYVSSSISENFTPTAGYESISVPNTNTICHKSINDTLCTTTGFMPDYAVTNCNGYKLCLIYENGSFSEYRFTCPNNSVFDLSHNMCLHSATFKCACKDYTITYDDVESPPGSHDHMVTHEIITEKPCPINDCISTGLLPEYAIPDCRGYKSCVESDKSIFSAISYMCPFRTVFDTNKSTCVEASSFICPCNNYFQNTPVTASTASPSESTLPLNQTPEQVLPITSTGSSFIVDTSTSLLEVTTSSPSQTNPASNQTASNICEIIMCETAGRFPDYAVSNCRGYKLCLRSDNITYTEITMECPNSWVYDVNKSICVEAENYECPCSYKVDNFNDTIQNFTSTEAANNTTESTVLDVYNATTEISPNDITSSSHITENNVTESTSVYKCAVEECQSAGRYPDFTVSSCRGYKLCLTSPNNTFNEVKIECPYLRVFDVSKSICVEAENYICPCNNVIETNIIITATTARLDVTLPGITTESSIVSETPIATNESIISYKCPHSIQSCTAVGIFPDYSASDCSRFYLCVQLNDGNYHMLSTACPGDNIFNANTSQCVAYSSYICLCTLEHGNETNIFTDNSNNNDTYSGITESSVTSSTELSNNGSNIVDSTLSTVSAETSPQSGITDAQVTFAECPLSIETCTAVGRYPDYSTNDCSKFFLCVLLNDGTYTMLNMSCPSSNLFNANLSQCVNSSGYECPCVSSVKTESDNVTHIHDNNITSPGVTATTQVNIAHTQSSIADTEVTTSAFAEGHNYTEKLTVCTESITSCPAAGYYPDYSSNDCRRFFNCVPVSDSSLSMLSTTCPGDQLYNVNTSTCVESTTYQCPCVVSATHGSSYAQNFSNNNGTDDVVNTGDLNIVDTGPLINGTNGTDIPLTTEAGTVITETTTIFDTSHGIQNTTNATSCPECNTTCIASGRYVDYTAGDCSRYFLCVQLNDGTFSKLNMTCPSNNLFDENVSQCVTSSTYTCPCRDISVIETSNSYNGSYNNTTQELITDIIELNITTTLSLDVTTQPSILESSVSTLNFTDSVGIVTVTDFPLYICPELTCSAFGRLADYSVSGCRGYKLCILSGTSFQELKLLCPSPNVYDPLLSICVEPQKYECTCA